MKSHISTFLLFFLLLNQSLSGTDGFRIPNSITKLLAKVSIPKSSESIKKAEDAKKTTEFLSRIIEAFIEKNESRTLEPTPQIEGLSDIKDYFSRYGYILSSGPFNDSYDKETISAIKTFQQYFNLPVTGDLNNQTIQQIALPRCGVPDFNFDFSFTDNVSYPKSGHRWFKGNNLTYGFLPASQIPLNMTKVFTDSFTRWANATGVLNLTETNYDEADIKIGFYNFTYLGFEGEVYGDSLIESISGVKVGHVLVDGNIGWALPSQSKKLSWEDGILDLESAAMHQIGHLLGLDHSNKTDSVMYPYVLPLHQRKVELSKSDRDNIQQQYADGTGSKYSNDGGRLEVFSFTTFSVAFAYVLLLY